jgi:F-type H+-transporting ATPase subunit b
MSPLLIPLATENPLAPAPLEIIMAVIFALLLWFLIRKYVVPSFEKTYAERTEAIQGGIEKAERAQAEAQAALEQYRAQLNESRSEAAKIREDAKTQGSQILAEMREQAQAEANRIRTQTQAQLEAERTQVMTQLRNEIGGMATTLAGRIVGESLDDDERARRTVDRFIADLESEQAGQPDGSTATSDEPSTAGLS